MGIARASGAVVVALDLLCVVTAGAQPADSAQLQQMYQEGDRALAERRYADAEKAFEQLRKLQPGIAEIHAKLGVTYYQEGRFADAIPVLRQALKLKPALPNVDALLAMSLSELGRYEEAIPGLRKTFKQSSDAVLKRMAGLHLQRAYTGLGRDADAVAVALDLTRAYPNDPEVLYHSGRLFANYAYLQTMHLADVAPDSVWLHQAAGEANESQQLWDAALQEYRQVLTQVPNRPGLHFRIGRVLLAKARESGDGSIQAQALEEFRRELQIDPTNANASYEIGEIERKAGRLDEAIAAFRAAVTAYPDFEEALVGLGRSLIAARQADGAIPLLEKALSLKQNDDVALYQLALAYRTVGRQAEQQKTLDEFRRVRAERQQHDRVIAPPLGAVTEQQLDPGTSQ